MINKNWNDVNYISVIFIIVLSIIGSISNVKKFCRTNKDKCGEYSKAAKIWNITLHLLIDSIMIGSLSVIVYLGLIGYGFNELFSVAVSGFLAKEGNTALYEIKLVIADKLNSESLKEKLKKEEENECV